MPHASISFITFTPLLPPPHAGHHTPAFPRGSIFSFSRHWTTMVYYKRGEREIQNPKLTQRVERELPTTWRVEKELRLRILAMETTSFTRNRYWVLRHGKSIPNETGLIVSSLENGTLAKYQLAPEGVKQAELAGELFQKVLKENNIPLENVRICYSPFSRTTHTAKIVASVLNLPFEGPQCKVMEDLRERFFGPSFELMSHDKYAEIWALDEKDPFMRPEGGECVDDVASRLANAMATIESEFQGCAVLIVSHGDPLQILQTILNAVKQQTVSSSNDLASRIQAVRVPSILSQHRKHGLLTAELRAVI